MTINLKSPSPVLVIISRMSVPICNRFDTKRANSGKIMSFLRGTIVAPLGCPRSRGTPASKGTKFCHEKLVLGQHTVKIS